MPQPISIESYRNIANLGMSQLALVTNDRGRTQIGAASEKVGFLQRLFNTSASKAVNIAITSDFKASLIREYGAKVADEAFSAVIGKDGLKGAKLSSALVRRTLSEADKIIKQNLECPKTPKTMLTMRLAGKDEQLNLTQLFTDQRVMVGEAKNALTELHSLLMDMPTDKLAFDEFKGKILDAKNKANSFLELDQLPKIKSQGDVKSIDKLIDALKEAVSMVDGKLEEAEQVCKNNPVTYKALSDFACEFIESAKAALDHLPDGGKGYCLTPQTLGQFQNFSVRVVKSSLDGLIPTPPKGAGLDDICPDPKAFVGKDFAQKLAKKCADLVMENLKARVPEGNIAFETVAFTKDLEKAIAKEMGDRLNNGSWDKITKNVTFALDGLAIKGQSVITPASQMGETMKKMYEGGPKGYNCMSFGEKTHAVNMAQSEFKVEIDGKEQTVFSGIRHGVHAAVYIDDQQEFKAANASRAKETLIAAFLSNPSLVSQALKNPSAACKFNFNSVSLLTPDIVRGTFFDKIENEKMMLKAQTEAYQGFHDQTIEVEVPDPDKGGELVKVKIQPNINTFNYGVNWGGVGGLSGLFGGWGATKDMNAKALVNLNKQVDAEINSLNAQIKSSTEPAQTASLKNKAEAINTLRRQINDINRRKSYASDGHEAYKMASRIAVLTNLLGGIPAWNCKSGKDRTGMMDVECKFLATLAALGKTIPEPGAQLTTEQKMLYRNLLMQSGNHEMQKYNTGIAGYKLENVGSITERIGDIASHRMFLGGSKLVHS